LAGAVEAVNLLERRRGLPGVADVAAANVLPLGQIDSTVRDISRGLRH
jgi:hypothetical protein